MTATIKRQVKSAGDISTGQAFGNADVSLESAIALLAAFTAPGFQSLAYQVVLTRAFQELAWQEGPPLDAFEPDDVVTTVGFSSHLFSPFNDSAANYADRLVTCGPSFFRDDYSASVTSSTIDTALLESFLTHASSRDLKLVLILMNTVAATPNLTTLQNYAANIVTYAEANHPGVLIAIEPRNEPNLSSLYPNTAVGGAAYAPEVTAVYNGVHSVVGTTVKVWGGATSGGGVAFTDGACGAGVLFDEWSCHPYPNYSRGLGTATTRTAAQMLDTTIRTGWAEVFWAGDPAVAGTPNLATVLSNHGYDGLIHCTETGIPTLPPSGTDVADCWPESRQAEVFTLAYSMWIDQPRAGLFAQYTGQDDHTDSTTTRESHFGAFWSPDQGTTPNKAKPVVAAIQAVT